MKKSVKESKEEADSFANPDALSSFSITSLGQSLMPADAQRIVARVGERAEPF